jgi:hypothetical protein
LRAGDNAGWPVLDDAWPLALCNRELLADPAMGRLVDTISARRVDAESLTLLGLLSVECGNALAGGDLAECLGLIGTEPPEFHAAQARLLAANDNPARATRMPFESNKDSSSGYLWERRARLALLSAIGEAKDK